MATLGDLKRKAEQVLADFSQPKPLIDAEKEPYYSVVHDAIKSDQKAILFLIDLFEKEALKAQRFLSESSINASECNRLKLANDALQTKFDRLRRACEGWLARPSLSKDPVLKRDLKNALENLR